MAKGERAVTGSLPPVDGQRALFRAGPRRDPADPGSICRFLARETTSGALEPAAGGVDLANRCTALGEPVPQSGQQQELVCLVAAHVNCPRFQRGVLAAAAPPASRGRQPISAAVIAATFVLAAAIAASFGFLAVRGGFDIPVGSGPLGPIAVTSTPTPAVEPSPAPIASAPSPSGLSSPLATPAPTASPSPVATPSPAASPSPALTPRPTATPASTPAATRTPSPSSDRFALLTKCPGQADCWIYVIRSGDNLRSIANYFGVSYDRILQMNPSITDPTTVHAGQQLKIPTPTR